VGNRLRKKSVFFVGITSVIALLVCVVGLGMTLVDYFDTQTEPPTKATVKPEAKTDKKQIQIVAIGDSLTRGTGDTEGKGYVGYLKSNLEKKTKQEIALTNLGIKGLTSSQLATQIKEDEIQRQINHADVILITIGGNDLFRGGQGLADLRPETLEPIEAAYDQNLNSILSGIRARNENADIFLVGLYNPFIELENAEQTSKIVRGWNYKSAEITARYPKTVFVPTFDLFQLNVNDYLFTDQFHPNIKGYQIIAERVAALITM
jgi:lysophospholipase L1-like esterase